MDEDADIQPIEQPADEIETPLDAVTEVMPAIRPVAESSDFQPVDEPPSAERFEEQAPAEPVREPAAAEPVTQVLPVVEPAEGPLYAEPVEQAMPRDPAWPLLGRVLVLPRSTFARLSAEGLRVWPLAFGALLLAGLLKTLVAVGVALTAGAPAGRLVAVLAVRYGTALAGPLLFAAAAAGILKLSERAWQGDASFGLLVSATSLACMPLAVRNVIQALYMGFGRTPLVYPGLSALVGHVPASAVGRVVFGLLAQVDLFAIWTFVLLVLGACVTRGRAGFRRTAVVVALVAVWLILGLLPSFAVAAAMR